MEVQHSTQRLFITMPPSSIYWINTCVTMWQKRYPCLCKTSKSESRFSRSRTSKTCFDISSMPEDRLVYFQWLPRTHVRSNWTRLSINIVSRFYLLCYEWLSILKILLPPVFSTWLLRSISIPCSDRNILSSVVSIEVWKGALITFERTRRTSSWSVCSPDSISTINSDKRNRHTWHSWKLNSIEKSCFKFQFKLSGFRPAVWRWGENTNRWATRHWGWNLVFQLNSTLTLLITCTSPNRVSNLPIRRRSFAFWNRFHHSIRSVRI